MKTTIIILLILTLSIFWFGRSEAAFCQNNGYCHYLTSEDKNTENNAGYLAAIFNPKDKPETIFANLFNFGLGFVGVGALVMIVIEGIRYMASGGNQSKTEESKRKIWNAIWGLILALISYLLLQTINPDLVNPSLKKINLQEQKGFQEPEAKKELDKCLYNQSEEDCKKLKEKECSKPTSDPANPCYCVQHPEAGICRTTSF